MPPSKRSPKPPSLHARKQEFVRGAIWEAALDLFAGKGFDETTVDDIAAAAGVSQRTFFRYFSSKNDLVANTLDAYADAVISTILACPRHLPPPEVLRQAVRCVVEQSIAYPGTRKIMAVVARYPAARAAQMARVADTQVRIAEAYARRFRQRKHQAAPKMLAAMTSVLIDVVLQSWIESGDIDPAAACDEAFDTLATLLSRS